MKTKVRRWIFFSLLCLVLVFSTFNIKNRIFATDEAKTIRVGIYDNKPKVFLNNQGEAAGLFPDILNYIAQKENWQLEYIFGTWEEGLARLENDEIDVMVDVALSKERQAKFDFSNETVFNSWGVIFIGKKSAIDSFEDLGGKKIAILKSSVYYGGPEGVDTYLTAFGLKAEFVEVSTQADIFDLINKEKVDAGVVSRVFALGNQQDYPNIKKTDIFFSPTELRFALTKDSPDNQYLIDRLDYWMKKLKEGHDGVYQQILTANDLAGLDTTKEVIPRWVFMFTLISLIILLILWQTILRLRHSRAITLQKLRAILASIGEGLFVVDLDGKLILVNRAFEDLLGWKQQEAQGKLFVELVPAQDNRGELIPQDQRPISISIRTGREIACFSAGSNYFLVKKDKTRIPIAYRVTLVKLNGKTIGAVGVFRDITEEKAIDNAKTEFVSIASHQLRTPLGVTKWYLEALKEEMYTKNAPPKISKYLQVIYQSNERIICLVHNLLSVSRIDQKKIKDNPVPSDVVQLVKSIIKELEVMAAIKKVKINLIVKQSQIPVINIDSIRLHEVIENLIKNAIEYNVPSGKVDITIDIRSGDILRISIKDTGIGLSEIDQKQLFTKFFRSKTAVSKNPDGSGLGLYVAKSYIEAWGGKIALISHVDQGSNFIVTIPFKSLETAAKSKKKASQI